MKPMSVQTVTRTKPLALPAAQRLFAALEAPVGDALDGGGDMAVSLSESETSSGLWRVEILHNAGEAAGKRARQCFAKAGFNSDELTAEHLESCDWVARSLRELHPIRAGRFFLHGDHDRPRRPCHGTVLHIDAGMAFGTGHHETTRSCLLAIEAVFKRGWPGPCLDIGCGSGVLALAMAKMSRRLVIAGDNDPQAVRVTTLNARVNGLAPWVRSFTASGCSHPLLRDHGPYGLVVANILARPLARLAGDIRKICRPGGTVILSGLTGGQLRWLTGVYRAHGLVLKNRILRRNWGTLVFIRPGPRSAR